MSYFLAEKPMQLGNTYTLTKDEARHVSLSRRVKMGEKIILQGPDERRFMCVVTNATKDNVTVSAEHEIKTPEEPKLNITIFQALISENALDTIIQKITELGATSLVIFPSKHSPNSITEKKEKKLERWNRISIEAAKQSDRVKPLSIEYADTLEQTLKRASKLNQILLLDKTSSKRMKDVTAALAPTDSIGAYIGPEGGFSPEEDSVIQKLPHALPISLGPRILRADSAALSITAIIQALWGDL